MPFRHRAKKMAGVVRVERTHDRVKAGYVPVSSHAYVDEDFIPRLYFQIQHRIGNRIRISIGCRQVQSFLQHMVYQM